MSSSKTITPSYGASRHLANRLIEEISSGKYKPGDRLPPLRKLAEEFTREVIYIGHKNGIKDDLDGIENLRVTCALDGAPISEQQAWDALEQLGMRGHEDLPTRVLSQGQKRRIGLARLLVHKAKLWILDEPFTALDKAAVGFLQGVIRDHIDRGGMVILTTHQEVTLTEGQVKRLQLGWKEEGRV